MSFVIPVNPQDLFLQREGRLQVTDVSVAKMKPAALVAQLEEAEESFHAGPFVVTETKVFDLLFCCARFDKKQKEKEKRKKKKTQKLGFGFVVVCSKMCTACVQCFDAVVCVFIRLF